MNCCWKSVATGIAFSLFACLAGKVPVWAQIPDQPGWRIIVNDEFDGPGLNTTLWEPLNRRDSFNDEKQYYHPNQVTVVDGNLNLMAIDEPRQGKAYQSGLITSKALYGPGRFEARVDLPTTQGMWPAFWLNANHVSWPQGGEIDILENRGSQPELTSSAFHWQKDPGPCCGQHQFVFREYTAEENGVPVNFHAGFHTYAVEWEETQLRYYVDGNLYFTVNKNGAMSDANFTTPKNIIVNLAVGGHFGGDPDGSTVFPQTMLVDYVRVWVPQTGLQGDYNGDGKVDAADYTVWRDSNGQNGIGLPADGSGNGSIGTEDYEIWKANFSGEAPGEGASSQSVPEPGTAISISLGMMFVCSKRIWYASTSGRQLS